MSEGVIYALAAAALFGASTPLAKLLLAELSPLMLAALLYLGSGIGLSLCHLARTGWRRAHRSYEHASLTRSDLPWLAGAIAAGGIAGPVLLMTGLQSTPASSASLLLNMEGVFTALLAWFAFKENFDRRIVLGMLLITVAGVVLSLADAPPAGLPRGALAVLGACLCWGMDNNLTRKVAAADALQIAAIKGLVAGAVNLLIALASGLPLPPPSVALAAGALGLCGYGLSLVLFVLALRHLGSARTGAYFSGAPFFGALLALLLPGAAPGGLFWLAAALMAAGLWLHLSERHIHAHRHDELEHQHRHVHDAHHQHEHDGPVDPAVAHTHRHRHTPLTHAHPHFPDIHHRHHH